MLYQKVERTTSCKWLLLGCLRKAGWPAENRPDAEGGRHVRRPPPSEVETTSLFAHIRDLWSTKNMSLTHSEVRLFGDDSDRITNGIAKAVENSFKVRPMLNITEGEVERRIAAAFEGWRAMVHEGGYDPVMALTAVTLILVEYIDRTTDGALPNLINAPFLTHMLPHNMTKGIQAERALSALSNIHGTIDAQVTH